MDGNQKNDFITLKDNLWNDQIKKKEIYFDEADLLKQNYKSNLKTWNEYNIYQRKVIYNIS